MALNSGFYNALESGGVYDRVYSADEYTNFYSAFIKDGVRRSGEDDFKCTASGLVITIAAGYAICGSKWVHNDAIYTLPAITPPVGDYSRIDGVFLHVDTNEATRAASIIYRQGTPASTPTAPAKDTTAGVYELCLCTVGVAPSATTVTLTDTRGNSELCGWITTPVGADDFFQVYDDEMTQFIEQGEADFNDWFEEVRDTLASVTLFKQYTWYYKTTATQTTDVTFSIAQYDPTGVDIVNVYVNGMREVAGVDYTLSGSTITFTNSKVAGTEIFVVVYKSIDGRGLGSVSDEITELQTQVGAMQDAYEFNYVCNGNNDRDGIVSLARTLKENTGDYDTIKINVYGDFGQTDYSTHAGSMFEFENYSGSVSERDDWAHRKLILDFSHCSCVNLDGSLHTGQYASPAAVFGWNMNNATLRIVDLTIIFANITAFIMPTQGKRITCDYCRIWHNGSNIGGAYIAGGGTFNNCRCSVTSGSCFRTGFAGGGILKVNGGEYYAFKKTSASNNDYDGYVIHVANPIPVFTSQMSCPTVSRSGFTQVAAIYDTVSPNTAHASYSDTLTALTITATGQNVRGTISQSVQVMDIDT